MEDYETFGETYDRPEKPRRIRRPVTAKPNPHQIKPMNDKPKPTVNDIKLPVQVDNRILTSVIFDADSKSIASADSLEVRDAIVTALNQHPQLLAERDALREALKRLVKATDDYYRNPPSTETVEEKCVEMVLADEQARLALAKGGGE